MTAEYSVLDIEFFIWLPIGNFSMSITIVEADKLLFQRGLCVCNAN